MGKRQPPERKERRARDAVRRLTSLAGMDGVPWLHDGRLWLVGPLASRPAHPAPLARTLLARELPDKNTLAHLMGARRQVPLDVAALAGWARDVAELEACRDLEALVEEGVRPLRRYRGTDLRGRIRAAGRDLERLGLLVQSLDAAVPSQEAEAAPESLVRALPLRLYALGDWVVDPVEELQAPDVHADDLLRQLARTAADPGVAALAALLLGARRRHLPAAGATPEDCVPGVLVPAYQAGMAGCCSPCLWALVARAQGRPPEVAAPSGEAARLVRAAERVALLYGAAAGLSLLGDFERSLEGLSRLQARLDRFEELVDAHHRGRRPRPVSPQEAELVRGLHEMDAPGAGAARVLVELFLAWVGGPRLVPRRSLRRLAEEASPAGLTAAARAVCQAWQSAFRAGADFGGRTSEEAHADRLALALLLPGTPLHLPPAAGPGTVAVLREVVDGLSEGRAREIWPVLTAPDTLDRLEERNTWWKEQLRKLVRTALPVRLVSRAVRLYVVDLAVRFADNAEGLQKYLDCLESLGEGTVPNLDVRTEWFAGLFRSGRPWAPAVVLTLLNEARRKGAADLPAELFSLRQALTASGPLAPVSRALVQALEEWGTPAVHRPPPELEALAPLLGRSRLEEYLHYRRLAGHGETFAEALCEPVRQAERDTREADFLRARLAADGLAPDQRAHLAARLEKLADPERIAARREQAAGRAHKRMERSLALLRQESLERVLDEACRTYLRDLLGQAVPSGPLPAGLRAALQLLSAEQINHDLLAGFIADVLRGRPPAERPVNRAWLEAAAAAGVRTDAWLAGFRATVAVGGEPVAFAVEHDPLAVLRMGSYFDTCLSLEGGFNAASTLLNALDVNKQVVYGRRPDGTVVARKLIGATRAGELAGYRTYATRDSAEMRLRLAGLLREHARRCNLRLSDTATPEILHSGFWYDDGNESWPPEMPGALAPPPAGVPADAAAASEWNLCQALADGDAERLEAVVVHGVSPWREAALFQRIRQQPTAIRKLVGLLRGIDGSLVAAWLAYRGQFESIQSLAHLDECYQHHEGRGFDAANLPADPRVIRSCLRVLPEVIKDVAARDVGWSPSQFWLPPFAAVAPLEQILPALRAVSAFLGGAEEEAQWRNRGADLLQIAYFRDGDAAPLGRALAEGPFILQLMIVELARREVIPRLAPALRKLLAQTRADAEVALALGTQGDPQDGPRLLALLRHRPQHLPLAVAVLRTGNAAAAEEARALWRPPRNLDVCLDKGSWLALERELGSRRLARALAREIRRRAYRFAAVDPHDEANRDLLERMILRLAFLALPGPEGDVQDLLKELMTTEPYRREEWFFRERLGQIPAWAEASAIEQKADALARGGAEALEALAWWQRLRETTASKGTPLLRHDRCERSLRRLAIRGTPVEQAAALKAWLALTPQEQRYDLLSGWLGFLGAEGGNLGEELRRDLVQACWSSPGYWPRQADMEMLLTWLGGLAPETRRQVLGDMPERFAAMRGWTDLFHPVWLLRLEDPDLSGGQAVADLLEAWARLNPDDELLRVLDQALTWLRPEAAEPLLRRVLAALDVRDVHDALLACLTAADPPRSYRLQQALLHDVVPRLHRDRRLDLARSLVGHLRNSENTGRKAYLMAWADGQLVEPT